MSTFTEDDIRQALQEFTDTTAPVGVQQKALKRARRTRLSQGAALVAVVAAAVAAVAVSVPGKPETPAAKKPERVDIVDGLYFAAGPAAGGTRVWNRTTGRYDLVPGEAWPNPDGTKIVVATETGVRVQGQNFGLEITDKALVDAPQWNDIGTKLLVGIDLADGKGSVQWRLIDLTHSTSVDMHPMDCGAYCVLVWLPGFDRVAHLAPDGTMTVYAGTSGARTSTLNFTARRATAWSPDGTKIVTDAGVVDSQGRLLCSLSLGTTLQTRWLDNGAFVVVAEKAYVVGADCRVLETHQLPSGWAVTEPAAYTIGRD
jgi:hypothetical protein